MPGPCCLFSGEGWIGRTTTRATHERGPDGLARKDGLDAEPRLEIWRGLFPWSKRRGAPLRYRTVLFNKKKLARPSRPGWRLRVVVGQQRRAPTSPPYRLWFFFTMLPAICLARHLIRDGIAPDQLGSLLPFRRVERLVPLYTNRSSVVIAILPRGFYAARDDLRLMRWQLGGVAGDLPRAWFTFREPDKLKYSSPQPT